MVPCEPALQVPFLDGDVVGWWSDPDRTAAEWSRISEPDARTFLRLDGELKSLARYLQPFFLEPPPDIRARGMAGLFEMFRLGKRFRGIRGEELERMVAFLTGSLGDYLDRSFESDKVKTMFLANNVYGKHGGPYHPGTALGLLFHLLSGGEHDQQGFFGHVIGGMGSITEAMASACRDFGATLLTEASVDKILTSDGRIRAVVLEDGREVKAKIVLSNADPKRTFLGLVDVADLPPEFVTAVRGIKMDGPSAKVNLVLSEEPRVIEMPEGADAARRSVFTLVPSLEFAERSYHRSKLGEIPEELWVDCVVASNVDDTLAPPDRHILTCFVQYVPYRLRKSTWDAEREHFGDRVLEMIGRYAPNVPGAVVARQILTPLDLEREYGLTEGNIFHGDLSLEQLFFMRPVPGWSRYRSPIEGLYLCGAGAHPGGGVTGAPGYNAAHVALADFRP